MWDATGGTAAVGGSGGVSLTGTGINQTTSVFGRIAANTVLPNIAGNYTDDVIVTITY
ncbi:MAG: spore coat protein U domain-containing protein [Acinetobacter sp.]